jgi:hypothetical protein
MLNSKINRFWIKSILAIASLLIGFLCLGVVKAQAAETLVYSTYSATNNGNNGRTFIYNALTNSTYATVHGNCYSGVASSTEINTLEYVLYRWPSYTTAFSPSDFQISIYEVSSCTTPVLGDFVAAAQPTQFSSGATTTVKSYLTTPFSFETGKNYMVYIEYMGTQNTVAPTVQTRGYTSSPNTNAFSFRKSAIDNVWVANSSDLFFNFYNDTAWEPSTVRPDLIAYSRNYQTRFTAVDYTLSSTTLAIDASYFIEMSEIDTSSPTRNPTEVQVQWSLNPTTDVDARSYSALPLVQGDQTLTVDATGITDGIWDVYVGFSNLGHTMGINERPFNETYIQFSIEVSGGVIVASSTTEVYTGQDIENPNNVQCSLTAIDGCISKAVMFLMVPGDYGMSYLDSVYNEMSTRFPFAYMTDFKDSITQIYTNPTTQTLGITIPFASFGDITLISGDMVSDFPLSAPIKTLLSALLWVMLATQMWRRTQRIFNPSHI